MKVVAECYRRKKFLIIIKEEYYTKKENLLYKSRCKYSKIFYLHFYIKFRFFLKWNLDPLEASAMTLLLSS